MNHWHFPRHALATGYLDLLEQDIAASLALIAPRRKGKTMFLLQDLAPLAQQRGYLPVYASFWQCTEAPHEGLMQALEEAIESVSKQSTLSRLLKAKVKKTALSNELLGKVEVEFSDKINRTSNRELIILDKLLQELQQRAGSKTILLLLDEVQHLTTTNKFSPLAYALRTMLDKRQGRVKALLTGSSRHYMHLLFNSPKSPFYHFVEPILFENLGEEFIVFIQEKLQKEHAIALSSVLLTRLFKQLERSPYWMLKFVSHLILNGGDVKAAKDHVLQLLNAAEGFDLIAKRLKPIDKVVFLALSEDVNPYSKPLLKKISRETNVKGIPANVQRAIHRLAQAQLISQTGRSEYWIEKPGLKVYLEEGKQQ